MLLRKCGSLEAFDAAQRATVQADEPDTGEGGEGLMSVDP